MGRFFLGGWCHQLVGGFKNRSELDVVVLFERDSLRKSSAWSEYLPQLHEGAHNHEADFYCAI